MSQQTIDIGAAPNDGTGDPIRDAFDKCNDNFTELYAGLVGLLDFKSATDCSANPNYPAASKGDAYVVSVAGKIGGGSGTSVDVGDWYVATADNAGGTEASVGASWGHMEHNLASVISGSLASTTEVLTGTDSSKLVTPDALAALWEKGADIASSGTISVGEGGTFHVTGTTGITDIDPATDKAGRAFWLVFDGILTLTHHATTLILPTGANITTAAGDAALFVSEGSDAVRCVGYQRANGQSLAAGAVSLTLASTVTQSGTPVATSVGFLGAPQMSDQDDYTLALVDSGGHYYHVSGTPHTLTIPANGSIAFPIGTVIAIVNENGAGAITLAITSDTLRWGSSTGSRTIAANGTATLLKVTSSVWRLTGDGIT